MAGEWIKMRLDLATDPSVVRIASALGINEDEVVGKLHRLWSWADRHTTDGCAPGITAKWVDRYLGLTGFADAMCASGWLIFTESGIEMPNFWRHNGHTAKQRAEATLRQRLSRSDRDMGVTGSSRDVIPRPFRRHVLMRDGYRCVFCGVQSSRQKEDSGRGLLSVDHLAPVTRGGRTVVPNLVTCCRLCNGQKSDRTPEEWGTLPTFLADGLSYSNGFVTEPRDTSVTNVTTEEEEEKNKKKKETPLPPIPESLDSPEFREAWSSWIAHRKEKREPVRFTSASRQLKQLAAMGRVRAIACIEHTIFKGWTGLREAEPERNGYHAPASDLKARIAQMFPEEEQS